MTNNPSPTCSQNVNNKTQRLQRAQWLRAAILGASDGLLSTTSLMLGIGAAQEDKRSMILSGLAGALAGTCSMAVGEFVSVSTQRDIERATAPPISTPPHQDQTSPPIKLDIITIQATTPDKIIMSPLPGGIKFVHEQIIEQDAVEIVFTSPYKAAGASAMSFLCGSSVPLLSALFLSSENVTRILVMMVITSVASAVFGGVGAYLGGSPGVRKSAIRVVIGGWIATAITYGLLKPFDNDD